MDLHTAGNWNSYFKTIKMKFKIANYLITVVSIATILLSFTGCDNDESTGNAEKFKEIEVKRGLFEIVVSANGVVKPIDRIEIKSKASGQIEELSVEEGDFVKKGELIARLDQKDERSAVIQAEADLNIAQSELKQAQRAFDRRDHLFQSDHISEEERDDIELRLAIARSKLIQMTTTLERARERLAESVVRATIDGVILQKYVEEGQIISSGVSSVSGGTAIADIADMSSVYIETGIDEVDIGKIEIGQTSIVVAEAYPQVQFSGKVVRIAPEAKVEQNVTLFDVIVEVSNTEARLKSGMNTNIEITIVSKEDVLLTSTIALNNPEDEEAEPDERIVQLKEGDLFVPHTVKTGFSNFRVTELVSGLKEGDIIGVPMNSRLKAENDRLIELIKDSRSFGAKKKDKPK